MKIEDINIKEVIESEASGEKFNRYNKIKCPIHGEKTASLSVRHNGQKGIYKCFGCGSSGDAINFIKDLKGVNYVEACKYLGIKLDEKEKTKDNYLENIKGFINWQFEKQEHMKGLKLLDIYTFVDRDNNIKYVKAKFKTPNGKEAKYYHINKEGKVINKRNGDEIPYNFYAINQAMQNDKPIFIVEGEKDADTLNYFGYKATSLKNVKDFSRYFKGATVYFIGDTGKAGEEYKEKIFKELKEDVKSFRVVDLTGVEKLGDNKDVTDWIEAGHTKEELQECIKDYWDIKEYPYYKYYTKKIVKDEMVFTPLKIWENLDILLKRKNIKIKYNKLKKDIEFISNSIDATLGNNAIIESIYSICIKNNLMLTKDGLVGAINRIARENSYNPVSEYLEKCYKEWDKKRGRVITLCNTVTVEKTYNESLRNLLIIKWLVNTVMIAFNEGETNTEGVLVFQGKQGIYKTRWINSIMPKKEWLKTGMDIDPDNKDKVHQATSYWITELGELDATMKKDQAKLKAFFTEKQDLYRKPYERLAESYPRLTSFYSTVNVEQFLKDDTGNRRYWVIPVTELCVDHEIELDQLWGEVMYIWKTGEMTNYLNQEQIKIINDANSVFEQKDDVFIRIMDSFEWDASEEQYEYMKVKDIASWCGIKNTTRMGTTLKNISVKFPACDKKRTKAGYLYKMPPKCNEDSEIWDDWEKLKKIPVKKFNL